MRPGISHTPMTPHHGAGQDVTSPGPNPKTKCPKERPGPGRRIRAWAGLIIQTTTTATPLNEAGLQQSIRTAPTFPLRNARLVSRTRPVGFGLSFVNDADVVGAAYREKRKGRQYQSISYIHMSSQDAKVDTYCSPVNRKANWSSSATRSS